MRRLLALLAALLLTTGCDDSREGGPVTEALFEQGFIDLLVYAEPPPEGVVEIVYAVRVTSGTGEVVWSDRQFPSGQNGLGVGDLSYVGTCDALRAENTVTVWISGAFDADGNRLQAAMLPCLGGMLEGDPTAWTGGCTRQVTCVGNKDHLVTFDLSNP